MRRSARAKKDVAVDEHVAPKEEVQSSIQSEATVKKERLAITKDGSRDSTSKVTMAEKVAVKKKRKVVVIEDEEDEKREMVLVKDELEETKELAMIQEDEDLKEAEDDQLPPQTPARRTINDVVMKYTYKGKTGTTQPSQAPTSTPKRKREEEDTPSEGPTPTFSTKAVTSTQITVKASTTPSPSKRRRERSSYAPPSTYAHLNLLKDVIGPSLICLFVGLNPGIKTATTGHAYSHPTNLFWRLLHSSGCTTRRCAPEEDQDLPRLFALGNTNIVARPTRNQAELSRAEMVTSVSILEEKVRKWRPEAVCLVGKGIWESVWEARHGKKLKKTEFRYGWQSERDNIGRVTKAEGEEWNGAKVFVATSTSGLAANTTPAEKEAIWRPLGEWVQQRRAQRGI